MQSRIGVLAACLAVVLFAFCVSRAPAQVVTPPEKIGLTILYAGHPGSEREKDFIRFLGERFQQVKTSDLTTFTPASATGSDVVIMDYDGDPFKAPRLQLPTTYTRATVTMGVVGADICGSLRLKSGYL